MHSVVAIHKTNILRVRSLGGLNQAIGSIVTPAVDLSDLLRAQHVLAVSAFDFFVHQVVREGMLEIFDGKRKASIGYKRFRISVDAIGSGATVCRSDFENEIRSQHSFLTFQQPDKVADALRLVVDFPLWDKIAENLGESPKTVKDTLKLIVERRNKIAHEADIDPTYPQARWPIAAIDVDRTIDFLDRVTQAMFDLIELK